MKKNLIFLIIAVNLMFCVNLIFAQDYNAGQDQEICINNTQLEAATIPEGYTGTWTIQTGWCNIVDLHLNNTFVTDLIANSTVLRWTITNGIDTYYDEVNILNNQVNPVQISNDAEICVDEYTIVGSIHTEDATGLWTLISGYGEIENPNYFISDVTNLGHGNNKFKWTVSKGICSSSDSIIVTNNSVEAHAGNNQTICADTTQLQANETEYGEGTWAVIHSNGNPIFTNINNPVTNISGLGKGNNSLKWTVVFEKCSDYDVVVISDNTATVANAGNDETVCENYTLLSGNNATYGTGEWTVITGNSTPENPNNYNTIVNNLSDEINKFKWTITNFQCSSFDEVEIFYQNTFVNAGKDSAVCSSEFQLSGNQNINGTGLWEVVGGSGVFSDENLYNTSVSGMLQGENTFAWTITENDCPKTDYVTIINNLPLQAATSYDREICVDNTQISANNPMIGSGVWSVESGTGIFSNPNNNMTNVNNISEGNNVYRWTVINDICTSFDDLNVVNNHVSSNAGTDQTICGQTIILNGNQPETGETGIWTVIGETAIIINNTFFNTAVTELDNDDNIFNWSINKGICTDIDQVIITNNLYIASAEIIGQEEICIDYSEIAGNQEPFGGVGKWEIVSGSGNFDDENHCFTFVRNLEVGENIIAWTISKGECSHSDTIEITVHEILANAGEEQFLCQNYTSLQAEEPENGTTGIWTKLSGSGIIQNPTSHLSDVTNLSHGLNYFRWTVSGYACSNEDEIIITNNSFNIYAGITQHICNSATTLYANNVAGGYGYWTLIEGTGNFTDISLSNTEVTGILNNSENIYRWTIVKNECSDFDDLVVFNDFIIADAGPDQYVCFSETILAGNNPSPGTGHWELISGEGNISEPYNHLSEITNLNLSANLLRWSITSYNCMSDDYVDIIRDTVIADAGIDKEICNNYTNLDGYIPQNGAYGLWEIIEGDGTIQNPSLYNTLVTNLAQGNNIFKWIVFENGCFSAGDEITVTNNSFQAFAGEDIILPSYVTATTMEAELPVGSSASWLLIAGSGNIADESDPETAVFDMQTGTNTFQWTVELNNCEAVDEVNITVENSININNIKKSGCYIFPNPCTGNFKIIFDEINKEYEIIITDISGKIIYKNKQIENNINISNQASGIYFVKIIYGNKNYVRRIIIE